MLMTVGDEPCYIAGKVSEQLFSRKTGAEGRFRFERIPADAAVEFIVKKPGLATVGTFKEDSAQSMQLQYKAGQEDIEITLPAEARIEGTVVEKATVQPVPNIKLMAYQGEHQPFTGQEPVISGDDGIFTIGGLCPGKHIIRAVPGEDWVAQPVEVSVEAGKTATGVNVELSKGGVVEISVIELYDNVPISGANVHIRNMVSKKQFSEKTDKDGIFRKRLAPGEYKITQVHKQDFPYERREGEETFTVEDGKTNCVVVELKGYPKVSGTVRDENGRPVAGAKVKVCPLGRNEATSDAKGQYEVRRQTPNWAPDLVPFVVARHFERNLVGAVEFADDAKVVDVTMTLGVTCVGKVVDPDGKPIENAKVYLTFWSSGSGSSMARQENTTNAQGYYEIKAVPRHYRYSVNASADGYGEDYLRISTEEATNHRFEVEPISLATANLSVSGIVVDMDDKPVENARVYCQDRGQPYRDTRTNQDGRFALENLCAGKVTIRAGTHTAPQRHGRIETEGGATGVKVVISERPSSTRYEPKRPPSLVGKPLPDLKEFGIDLASDQIEGKRLLVCFWDMNQRPSRHCLTQLAKQTKTLRDKGVLVVAVQASKIDEEALNEWLKRNSISFPVGIIQADEEQSRFNWGIKSQPWLILTDKNHVVRSEGIRVENIDDLLVQLGDN
jgi:protocatechuate 3,4-dioxygenase beta subunit